MDIVFYRADKPDNKHLHSYEGSLSIIIQGWEYYPTFNSFNELDYIEEEEEYAEEKYIYLNKETI